MWRKWNSEAHQPKNKKNKKRNPEAQTARCEVMVEMEGKRVQERQNEAQRYFEERSSVVVCYGENYRPGWDGIRRYKL